MLWSDPFASFFMPSSSSGAFLPPVDVMATGGDLVLTFDLPGLTSQDVDIELVDDTLTVRGARRRPQVSEGTTWTHAERPYGVFERRFRVPRGIDPDSIAASMENGVLSLIVPKPERLRPKTITIGAGSEQRELEATSA
jgi:HSP20 family protein